MYVYVVYYFDDDDRGWVVDDIFRDGPDADRQVDGNKKMGLDSYVDPMELR